jgi:hypothetical protein
MLRTETESVRIAQIQVISPLKHAMFGDLYTVALVGNNGSID